MKLTSKFLVLVFFTLFSRENLVAQLNTIPGAVTTPFPTMINLCIEWMIKGDDNQNGVVAVFYRKKGSKAWQKGMPLCRVPAGQ